MEQFYLINVIFTGIGAVSGIFPINRISIGGKFRVSLKIIGIQIIK